MTDPGPGPAPPDPGGGARPGPEALPRLRHDLRTPVGHILGYGEMLLEDPDDLAPAEAEAVAAIRADGLDLLGRLDRALAVPDPGPGPADLADLGRDLLPAIDRVRLRAGDLAGGLDRLGPDGPARDARRIAEAAARLREMVSGRLIGGPG